MLEAKPCDGGRGTFGDPPGGGPFSAVLGEDAARLDPVRAGKVTILAGEGRGFLALGCVTVRGVTAGVLAQFVATKASTPSSVAPATKRPLIDRPPSCNVPPPQRSEWRPLFTNGPREALTSERQPPSRAPFAAAQAGGARAAAGGSQQRVVVRTSPTSGYRSAPRERPRWRAPCSVRFPSSQTTKTAM